MKPSAVDMKSRKPLGCAVYFAGLVMMYLADLQMRETTPALLQFINGLISGTALFLVVWALTSEQRK